MHPLSSCHQNHNQHQQHHHLMVVRTTISLSSFTARVSLVLHITITAISISTIIISTLNLIIILTYLMVVRTTISLSSFTARVSLVLHIPQRQWVKLCQQPFLTCNQIIGLFAFKSYWSLLLFLNSLRFSFFSFYLFMFIQKKRVVICT